MTLAQLNGSDRANRAHAKADAIEEVILVCVSYLGYGRRFLPT